MPDPSGQPTQAPAALPRETLLGVRRGEPEALAALFEHAFDRVYGLAYRMLGERAAAEDVVQEVFLRVHRTAGAIDTERDPLPWLRTITANLCRDHWRSFANRVATRAEDVDDPASPGGRLANGGPGPEEEALATEREEAVQRAIDALPDPLREIVILRDYEGLDHGAIAEIVGASHAAVRKRYSRALERLAELLEGVWP